MEKRRHGRGNQGEEGEKSQFGLLTTRRFGPFFWTQFFGAFNDNVFKNALIIMMAYQTGRMLDIQSDILVNLAAGLFVLPFFLFSAAAGQIADKYDPSVLIRRIKRVEIGLMACAAAALIFNEPVARLALLFLMGAQSSFFGPVKYSILPGHLKPGEIVGGNAMVEMGSLAAILLGTLVGGALAPLDHGAAWIGGVVILLAVAGWLASRRIPRAAPASPDLKINWNPVAQTWKTLKYARKDRTVFLAILGISWFWLLGIAYLTQLPNFTREVLGGSESVVTLLLALFSLGVCAGSLLCERLSGKKVELGLVSLGALGISVFGFDLFLAHGPGSGEPLMNVSRFISAGAGARAAADLFMTGLFGGLYIVPLYALVQIRTAKAFRARVIAANNILNALFMVLSTTISAVLLGVAGVTIPHYFLALAAANLLVAAYIIHLAPEFVARLVVWMATHAMYRVRHGDLSRIPDEGPAVLVCNHVSYMDALIIAGSCRRPIRFIAHAPYYRNIFLHPLLRAVKAIPIESGRKNPAALQESLDQIAGALEAGDLVCIFPEGKLTRTGNLNPFRPGVEKIIRRTPAPVIPLALRGLWGSFFSHRDGMAMTR
ncbi:MAG: MFS transporter, partial [Desulfobacterales bacterium]|nr:MFS transporter [Desulfobacterales bacterium]